MSEKIGDTQNSLLERLNNLSKFTNFGAIAVGAVLGAPPIIVLGVAGLAIDYGIGEPIVKKFSGKKKSLRTDQ